MNPKKIKLFLCSVTVIFLIPCLVVLAQAKFPERAISIIVPWAPGGGGTLNTQTLHPYFEKAIGAGAAIVNKPGGGGTIGWNAAVFSPPDGYTVTIVNPSLLITRYTTKTGVDWKRFDPILLTVNIPAGVVVRTESPWKTFKEFTTYAKNNPGKVQIANSGIGAMYHIGNIGIEMATGAKFTHVPFKGTGPCITALLGGHVDASLDTISALLPYVESKRFRMLAISSPERNFSIPNVPTFREHGFDLDVGTWYGYCVPKGTPKDRIKILHDAFKKAIETKEFKDFYAKQGGVVEYRGPEGLGSYMEEQEALWKKIIDFSGYKPID